jgi:hypothetical protein
MHEVSHMNDFRVAWEKAGLDIGMRIVEFTSPARAPEPERASLVAAGLGRGAKSRSEAT